MVGALNEAGVIPTSGAWHQAVTVVAMVLAFLGYQVGARWNPSAAVAPASRDGSSGNGPRAALIFLPFALAGAVSCTSCASCQHPSPNVQAYEQCLLQAVPGVGDAIALGKKLWAILDDPSGTVDQKLQAMEAALLQAGGASLANVATAAVTCWFTAHPVTPPPDGAVSAESVSPSQAAARAFLARHTVKP